MVHRLAGLFKDYCGVLNEEALRMNFTLAYEILDEVIVSERNGPSCTLCNIICIYIHTYVMYVHAHIMYSMCT